MEIVVWMVTGAALGWITYSYFSLNQERGLVVSAIIGGIGGVIGGKLIAPMFASAAATAAQEQLSIATVLFAAAVAGGALAAGNLVHKRWGV